MKICSKCGETKKLEAFTKCRAARDGTRNYCKACDTARRREYYAANAESCREFMRQYCALHAERLREKSKNYRASNLEKCRDSVRRSYAKNIHNRKESSTKRYAANREREKAKMKKRYAANRDAEKKRMLQWRIERREELKQKAREYRAANIDRIKEQTKRRQAATLEQRLASNRLRRARKYNAPGSHTAREWRALVARFDGYCVRCRKHFGLKLLTRDHVVPLVQGGSDFIDNIQPLCAPCNASKGNRHATDYRESFDALGGGCNAA